jgi:hypothetical protein
MPALIVLVSITAGTLIDLDHFILTRLREANWDKLREAVRNPVKTAIRNEEFMGEKWLPPFLIIKSHLLELGILLVAFSYKRNLLVLVALFTISIHILCDVYADWRKGYIVGDYPG